MGIANMKQLSRKNNELKKLTSSELEKVSGGTLKDYYDSLPYEVTPIKRKPKNPDDVEI
jgi:hypothetical protein